jgi:hypothetical protein
VSLHGYHVSAGTSQCRWVICGERCVKADEHPVNPSTFHKTESGVTFSELDRGVSQVSSADETPQAETNKVL